MIFLKFFVTFLLILKVGAVNQKNAVCESIHTSNNINNMAYTLVVRERPRNKQRNDSRCLATAQ
jgi:hypothetical protein